MSREEKINQLLKFPNVHATRKHLESKTDHFIDALYLIESKREERELDAVLCSM